MTVKERIKEFVHYLGITVSGFEKSIGASNGYVNSISKSIGVDKINLILEKYPNINIEWLLTGKGPMLRDELSTEAVPEPTITNDTKPKRIPLVYQDAVAGFGNNSFSISKQDVKEYYMVPVFEHLQVDFMIEVKGNSMSPKYYGGDVVACRIIKEAAFIQWNKPHVVATRDQGLLVKRIVKGPSDDVLTLKSDNKNYPPFDVPKSDITGIALIVGVVRLE